MSINQDITLYLRQILQQLIFQVAADPLPKSDKPISQLIKTMHHQNYNLYQGKCFEQNSDNLCGYHATFNTFCFLSLMNKGYCQYNIESGASFWKFKLKIERFLMQFKNKQNLKNQWPWRQQDIIKGDFQRVYNKICLQKFQDFSIFHKYEKFYYLNHTWSFQYNNVLLDYENRNQLTNKFKLLKQHNGTKPMVLHLMLGITTHWMTFFAINNNGKIQYWFFDADDENYLDLNQQQITDFIEKQSKNQLKYGRKQYTKFEKSSYCQCIKDIQKSLKLIIDCIQQKQNLNSYSYNQKFQIFSKHLINSLTNPQDFSNVIREYQFNIQSFFIQQIQWNLLNTSNTQNLKKLMEYVTIHQTYSEQIQFLYEFTQIHICP